MIDSKTLVRLMALLVTTVRVRRQILHVNVTAHPSAAWVIQQLREAFPWDSAPKSCSSSLQAVAARTLMKVPNASPSRMICMPTIFACHNGVSMMSRRMDFSTGWTGKVFAAQGVTATRVEDLLQAAGISRRTFYKYFRNKEAVLLALYDVASHSRHLTHYDRAISSVGSDSCWLPRIGS